jgi:hypothetical protein
MAHGSTHEIAVLVPATPTAQRVRDAALSVDRRIDQATERNTMSDDIDIEVQLSRIAAALERIADRLDYLGEDGALSIDTEVPG